MADDRGDELRALQQMIEACRTQAIDLDMPALDYVLGKAEAALAARQEQEPQAMPRKPVPRGRIVRH